MKVITIGGWNEPPEERLVFSSDEERDDYFGSLPDEEDYQDFPPPDEFDPEAQDEMAREDAEGRSFEQAAKEAGFGTNAKKE